MVPAGLIAYTITGCRLKTDGVHRYNLITMNKRIALLIFLMISLGSFAQMLPENNRWQISPSRGITWNVERALPHHDHIEMSGEQISVVLRYGVDHLRGFVLERSFVWPMLRPIPNNTHASLMRRLGWDLPGGLVTVNARRLPQEVVTRISLDGMMTVESEFSLPRNGRVGLTRSLFPSTRKAAWCEKYVLRNLGETAVMVEIPEAESVTRTDPEKGVDGSYQVVASLSGVPGKTLEGGDSVVFYATFMAFKKGEAGEPLDVEVEWRERRALVDRLWDHLVLETPDTTLNTMFAFAKIRGAESIYRTKGGLMHGPGGESYYAAIWANDQAEYINPFFPFLGYDTGNQSALNSFRHFARFMNEAYEPIPSSIIAEGSDIWNGAGDRGDAAMIAYGAARYALARGDSQEAEELWPLVEWCLEYCRRNLNDGGVVASDSDELEGRFPAGDANLCTSSLYYDALVSAVYLGQDLGKPRKQLATYRKQAAEIRTAIDRYFGGVVEGFDTYRYYQENDILRSWICIPLTVGIYDRKEETIRALFSPRLWTENGLLTQAGSETFWDRSTLYALRGVLACGETEKGMDYLSYYSRQRLLGEHVPYAIEAWPEGSQRHLSAESGLYGRVITEGLFGIRPTGLRSFTFTPRLPAAWEEMSLKKIKAFGAEFTISVFRQGKDIRATLTMDGKVVKTFTGQPGDSFAVLLSPQG